VLCGCLWITASIVGSSLSLASTVQAFTVCFAGFLTVYVYVGLSGENRELLQRGAAASPLMKSARGLIESDWAKAMLLGIIFIPLPVYMLLSVANQLVRRCRGTASAHRVHPTDDKMPPAEDDVAEPAETPGCSGILTARVEQQMRQLQTWHWTGVHHNLQLLCMLAVALQVVGGMGTNIFLAWVNAKLDGAGFTTLTGMFFLVGTGMFMIPIVPGIAVYLFGGILIPAGYVRHRGTPNDYTHDTFFIGFAISVALNFMLKMVAIILQQKGIGEPMSTNLAVLRYVGANTPQMKAIELILKKPGLNFPKITILCGGPDWPTSVLTGILRLSLPQMLLGSTPVILNVAFVTAAGAFRLRELENKTWSAMSSVALTVASVWTVLQMALAAYYIQDSWERNHAQLSAPRKEHIELDWLDHVARKQQVEKNKLTKWGALPRLVQVAVFGASSLMLFSSFFMIMLQSRCWGNFGVTDDVTTLGLDFIKSGGWAAIGVFGFGCLLHVLVQVWTGVVTRSECKRIAKDLVHTKADWVERQNAICEETPSAEPEETAQEVHRLHAELDETKKELRELRTVLEEKGLVPPPADVGYPSPGIIGAAGEPRRFRQEDIISSGSEADHSAHPTEAPPRHGDAHAVLFAGDALFA